MTGCEMASAAVSNQILSALCGNQGCMDFQELESTLRPMFMGDLKPLLTGERFRVVGERNSELSAGALILARTTLRVCNKYPERCSRCKELHLCRYLVCGTCQFGNLCKNSHDLKSQHNSVVLKNKNLHFLEDSQIFQLLLQNDPSLVPEICSHYNTGNGDHGSCKYKTSCKLLHICKHFLLDECKFGNTCKRAHKFDETAMKILNERGFCQENGCTLLKIYKNKLLLTSPPDQTVSKETKKDKQAASQQSSKTDQNEICLFFLRKKCIYKEKCVHVHHHLPYKWEIMDKDGLTWQPFPNEEDVEKAYCVPDNNTSFGFPSVDFTLMSCEGTPVRRLSTVSSITKPPHFILTTEWVWYWKNDQGQWIEYDQSEYGECLELKTLEKGYLSEGETEIPFSIDENDYVIYIKDMCQKNLRHRTEQALRRRPRFVSVQDVEEKLKRDASEASSSSSVEIPDHWNKRALHNLPYRIIPLSKSAPDYKMLSRLFQHTMSSSTIHSIQRVQNLSLWRVFQQQKEQMKEKNEGGNIDQRYLFHGTDKSSVQSICEHNFDRRICGAHGSFYGKGEYFARDAKYVDTCDKSKGSTKMMFAALVLVGEFTKGSNNFLQPPQKPGQQEAYDSCVDNENNPAVFVIFKKCQIYPEYIIEYA